ncbi:MAG: winged helix-turn-helix domain-containing protein [Candidatus Eremiobacteraeota bacterium]|nr:winged helix-turn-helix domain-containing protein [Candidatus Eremiobacteraeota bacterium]
MPLAPKAAEALVLLATAGGEAVSKETLREALWPEGYVDAASLHQTIYLLRKSLDAAAPDQTPYIETVGRFGYRLIPALRTAGAAGKWPSRRRAAALVAMLILAVVSATLAGSQAPPVNPQPSLSAQLKEARQIGHALLARRDVVSAQKSFAYFRRVVRERPDSALGYADIASAYIFLAQFQSGKTLETTYREVERYARAALARDPQNAQALVTLGAMTFDRDGDFQTARALLRQSLKIYPESPSAWEMLAIIDLAAGDVRAGRAEMEYTVSLAPGSPAYQRWLGIAQYYGGDYTAAAETLRRSLDLAPNAATAYYLFLVSDIRGDVAGERHALHQIVGPGVNPDKAGAVRAFIAYNATRDGARRRARERLQRLAAGDADARFLLALVYRQEHRDRSALALLKRQTDRDVAYVYFRLIPLDPHFRTLYAHAG